MKSAKDKFRKRMSIVALPSQKESPIVSSTRRGLVKDGHASLFEVNDSIRDSNTSQNNVSQLSRSVLRRKSVLQNQESGTSSNKTRFVSHQMRMKMSGRLNLTARRRESQVLRNNTQEFIVPARFNEALKDKIKGNIKKQAQLKNSTAALNSQALGLPSSPERKTTEEASVFGRTISVGIQHISKLSSHALIWKKKKTPVGPQEEGNRIISPLKSQQSKEPDHLGLGSSSMRFGIHDLVDAPELLISDPEERKTEHKSISSRSSVYELPHKPIVIQKPERQGSELKVPEGATPLSLSPATPAWEDEGDAYEDYDQKLINDLLERELDNRSLVCKKISEYLIIRTTNIVYQIWKLIIVFLSFASSFSYMYVAAFLAEMEEDEREVFYQLDLVFQFIFGASMVIGIFVEQPYENYSQLQERRLEHLLVRYLKNGFLIDFLAIVPFASLFEEKVPVEFRRLFYLIRVVRLQQGLQLIDYKIFMKELQSLLNNRLLKIISNKGAAAENQLVDQTHITLMIVFRYGLQVFQLIVVLFFLSYGLGMLWYILTDLHAHLHEMYSDATDMDASFYLEFNFDTHTIKHNAIASIYFMFTTLSTVGLGDFHPKANEERLVAVVVMLAGVTLTSFIIENLGKMMMVHLRQINASYEESSKLSLFLSTLKKQFNSSQDLSEKFTSEIDAYFLYRWSHHKSIAVSTEQDQFLMEQLPDNIQRSIYFDFLFKNFMAQYRNLFVVTNRLISVQTRILMRRVGVDIKRNCLATLAEEQNGIAWENEKFQNFVKIILTLLEPQQLKPHTLFIYQFEPVEEITFLVNGKVRIGYNVDEFIAFQGLNNGKNLGSQTMRFGSMGSMKSIVKPSRTYLNKSKFTFPVALHPGKCALGLYEVWFDQPATYTYKTCRLIGSLQNHAKKQFDCFFIRKQRWLQAEKDNEMLGHFFKGYKTRVLMNYLDKINIPIRNQQMRQFSKEVAKQQGECTDSMTYESLGLSLSDEEGQEGSSKKKLLKKKTVAVDQQLLKKKTTLLKKMMTGVKEADQIAQNDQEAKLQAKKTMNVMKNLKTIAVKYQIQEEFNILDDPALQELLLLLKTNKQLDGDNGQEESKKQTSSEETSSSPSSSSNSSVDETSSKKSSSDEDGSDSSDDSTASSKSEESLKSINKEFLLGLDTDLGDLERTFEGLLVECHVLQHKLRAERKKSGEQQQQILSLQFEIENLRREDDVQPSDNQSNFLSPVSKKTLRGSKNSSPNIQSHLHEDVITEKNRQDTIRRASGIVPQRTSYEQSDYPFQTNSITSSPRKPVILPMVSDSDESLDKDDEPRASIQLSNPIGSIDLGSSFHGSSRHGSSAKNASVIGRLSHSEFQVDDVIREETNEDFNTLESTALNKLMDVVATPRSPVGKSKYVDMNLDMEDASSSNSSSDAEIMKSRSSRREKQSLNSLDRELNMYADEIGKEITQTVSESMASQSDRAKPPPERLKSMKNSSSSNSLKMETLNTPDIQGLIIGTGDASHQTPKMEPGVKPKLSIKDQIFGRKIGSQATQKISMFKESEQGQPSPVQGLSSFSPKSMKTQGSPEKQKTSFSGGKYKEKLPQFIKKKTTIKRSALLPTHYAQIEMGSIDESPEKAIASPKDFGSPKTPEVELNSFMKIHRCDSSSAD